MRILARALMTACLLVACTSGETQVEGGGGSTGEQTGPTAATGPTASGPTAATGGGEFAGPVSIDTAAQAAAGLTAAFYSCDGVDGLWTYIVQGGTPPIDFDIDTTVDMEGGDGTLVISDAFELPGLGRVAFTDTVELVLAGTPEAPTFQATSITVDIEGNIPGLEEIAQAFFTENVEVPILAGAEQC